MSGVHTGHRKRLRARAKAEGLKAFQPHEVLELLLMQVIPLRDVNPLAHRIIDRFGSVEAALTAPIEELVQISGVGERSANWLRAAGEMALAYSECWHAPREIVRSSADTINFLRRSKIGSAGDYILVCLDRSGRILHHVRLTPGDNGMPQPREMVRAALLHHAVQVFTVHYAFGSGLHARDTEFTIQASELFSLVEITHLDHIVVTADRFYSARRDGVIGYVHVEDAMAAERENTKT